MDARRSSLRHLASLAWRESRMARRRLLLSMSSVTLGVACLVAIDSLADNATTSVHDQARSLVGGDVSLSASDSFPADVTRLLDSLVAGGSHVAFQTTFPSMASGRGGEGLRLVQVRAITPGYPFFGDVETAPAEAWAHLHDGANVVVDQAVLTSLGITFGDSLSLGGVRFAVRGIITSVPSDVAISASIAPRVYFPARFLPATQLLGFGSRAQREAVMQLAPTLGEDAFAGRFGPRFRRRGVRLRTADDNATRVSDSIGDLRNFLSVVGLVALLLGGVGVASGVRAFVLRKIDTVAILRCLGATSGQVLAVYVTQATVLGLVGAIAGAVLGIALQFLAGRVAGSYLPAGLDVRLVTGPIIRGVLVGVWVALVCALQPLIALRRVSPLQALRRDEDAVALGGRYDWLSLWIGAVSIASLIAVTVSRAQRWQEGIGFASGIVVVVGALWLTAFGLSATTRRIVSPRWPFALRHGIASLHRPGNQTRAVVVSLGFGVFLVGALYETQQTLLTEMQSRLGQLHANVVFFDIQSDQRAGVDSILRAHGTSVLTTIPVLTVRIGAINGRTVKSMQESDAADARTRSPRSGGGPGGGRGQRGAGFRQRAIAREWRATYSDTLTSTESIASGRWFGAPNGAVSEVSLDSGAAFRIGVGLGDVVQWDVQGLHVTTRVTSLRSVDRTQVQPSFQVVFPSHAVAGAPMQFVILGNALPRDVPLLQRDVVRGFSNVSTVDLTLVEQTIRNVLAKVHAAIQGLALISVLLAIPVLFSAVAATRRERLREGVLLKTLGATRRQVGRLLLAEYLVLGALGSATGILLSGAAAWALSAYIFHVPFVPAPWSALGIAGLMTGVCVTIGLVTGREVFSATPMAALRTV